MQQACGQEGLILARPDLGAHQLRAGCQDTGVLLVEVDAGHGRHVVNVVVISEHRGEKKKWYFVLVLGETISYYRRCRFGSVLGVTGMG